MPFFSDIWQPNTGVEADSLLKREFAMEDMETSGFLDGASW